MGSWLLSWQSGNLAIWALVNCKQRSQRESTETETSYFLLTPLFEQRETLCTSQYGLRYEFIHWKVFRVSCAVIKQTRLLDSRPDNCTVQTNLLLTYRAYSTESVFIDLWLLLIVSHLIPHYIKLGLCLYNSLSTYIQYSHSHKPSWLD